LSNDRRFKMSKKKIIFCYPVLSTFIKKDLDFLAIHYKLSSHSFNPKNKFFTPFRFLHQFIFLIWNIFSAKLIICKFAGYHSFFPAIFGKIFNIPVLFILGGTECHSFPSIGYGSFAKPLFAWFMKMSYKMADHLAPVHESLETCDYTYDKSGAPKQGVRYFCPWLKVPATTIYYGYDAGKFYFTGVPRKPNSFITIAIHFNGYDFYRKGIDLIISSARNFPEASFTIIGDSKEELNNLPSNLKIVPFVPNDKLKDFLSEHEFYLQLSLAEGFPNALCEAMLCECIPIGSDVFGIPFIIGDSGFVLKEKNEKKLFALLNEAMKADKTTLAKKARERIKNNFPTERRQKELLELVQKLIKNNYV
jgi:glycosyltransferase involved in cell wall biosynthesis